MKKIVFLAAVLLSSLAYAYIPPIIDNSGDHPIMTLPDNVPVPDFSGAVVSPDSETAEENSPKWVLLKSTNLNIEAKAKVFVPLEIVSDVEIKALVVDSQELRVPFDIEFNKEPERKDYYSVAFSAEEIDIDNDGTTDTFIRSPKRITSRVLSGNEVHIKGANISREGTHRKRIHMTVEIKDGR